MSKLLKLSRRTSFSAYTRYELTGRQILFYTAEEGQAPIVIPKKLFEDWLGNEGKLSYLTEFYHPFAGRQHGYAYALADDYWNYQLREAIIEDLREYLQTL